MTRVLLDTSLLILGLNDLNDLPKLATESIKNADTVFVSSVSIWEMSIKIKIGKLQLNLEEMLTLLEERKVEQLPITWKHASSVKDIPLYHGDPFDRMLVAQAMMEPMILLTQDRKLSQYSSVVKLV